MLTSDFNFDLPKELIAQQPLSERSASRLLCLAKDQQSPLDCQFSQFADLLRPGDLLVMNNTRVIPARLYGHKSTGGKVEIMLERLLDQSSCLAQIRASKPPKPGSEIHLDDDHSFTVVARHDDLFELKLVDESLSLTSVLDQIGHIPLPPYIRREDEDNDRSRYQTVYAQNPGAVAAPTAGLHFDEAMLEKIRAQGIGIAEVTLHVGAGTFQPVRVDRIEEHRLHKEYIEVSEDVVQRVAETRMRGGRVVAIGTTSVRALESAAKSGELAPMYGDTDIFIYPGYKFRVVDALLTNFHLPESSLLMLVSAFAGYERVMNAYKHAVGQRYRFFSYGDAMWLEQPN